MSEANVLGATEELIRRHAAEGNAIALTPVEMTVLARELDRLRARISELEGARANADKCGHLEGTPEGTEVCYLRRGCVYIMGLPKDAEHSCDEMGCGSVGDHVLQIIDVALIAAQTAELERLRTFVAKVRTIRESWAGTNEALDLELGQALADLDKAGKGAKNP